MPRFKVVATAVLALALALMVASCSDSTDSPDQNQSKAVTRQNKLVQVHRDGENAHQSMNQFDFKATESECKTHYAATEGNDLGSDAMVDLGRKYFVDGCMKGPVPTIEAKAP